MPAATPEASLGLALPMRKPSRQARSLLPRAIPEGEGYRGGLEYRLFPPYIMKEMVERGWQVAVEETWKDGVVYLRAITRDGFVLMVRPAA